MPTAMGSGLHIFKFTCYFLCHFVQYVFETFDIFFNKLLTVPSREWPQLNPQAEFGQPPHNHKAFLPTRGAVSYIF
jgi:hypothetical protein